MWLYVFNGFAYDAFFGISQSYEYIIMIYHYFLCLFVEEFLHWVGHDVLHILISRLIRIHLDMFMLLLQLIQIPQKFKSKCKMGIILVWNFVLRTILRVSRVLDMTGVTVDLINKLSLPSMSRRWVNDSEWFCLMSKLAFGSTLKSPPRRTKSASDLLTNLTSSLTCRWRYLHNYLLDVILRSK